MNDVMDFPRTRRPPNSPKGNAAISSKPFNRALLETQSEARAAKASKQQSKAAHAGRKRRLFGSEFWSAVQGIAVPLWIIAVGVGIGVLMLPSARRAALNPNVLTYNRYVRFDTIQL